MTIIWSYNQKTGPENWAKLSHSFACAAEYQWQSPIELKKEEVDEKKVGQALDFHYQQQVFTRDFFNRSIHFLPEEPLSYVVFNEMKYYLNDIHFHHPSEHHLEGIQHDLEIHFVHVSDAGDRLVAGILLKEEPVAGGETASAKLLPVNETRLDVNVRAVLPDELNGYLFTGSLTTPPTEGPIQWFVFSETAGVARDYLQNIRNILPEENARPLQPKNGRTITYMQAD